MKKIKKIPKSFQRALWSYDIDKMDAEKDRTEIITQVLDHGDPDDLKQLFRYIPKRNKRSCQKSSTRRLV